MAFGQRKLSDHEPKRGNKSRHFRKKSKDGGSGNDKTGFKAFNLSAKTLRGLSDAGYLVPTEIQSATIELALQGVDILGAAKTGSGKTLAFLIPVLEKLEAEKWTHLDGVGALIITPTRELAYQIFETINKIGGYHDFSVGLVIGGKDLKFERTRMNKCNIVICTPGRLLQHMHENPLFNCDNMKILVLDEADRILDMGFSKSMDSIIENLPKERQTLLFSATQTKSVKNLARLSLVDPKYVAVHEGSKSVTPEGLVQKYVVCEAHLKLNLLWSFIKVNANKKILVFVSTCKQAKFICQLFVRLKPGTTMMALYGSLHQLRRMNIYNEFSKTKRACLIATDIASRGLDFPAVDWVLQLDCPEDTDQYIHRAGRTARYHGNGQALLFLLPSEEKSMIEQLEARKVPISKSMIPQNMQKSMIRKAEALLARDVSLKDTAQRAFKAYLKDIFMMKDKTVFDVTTIDKEMLAHSYGLVVTPRVRFLENKKLKNSNLPKKEEVNESDQKEDKVKPKKELTLTGHASDESDGEDLFISRKVPTLPDIDVKLATSSRASKSQAVSQASLAKKILRKNLLVNKKIVFDDKGDPIEEFPLEQKSEKVKLLDEAFKSGIDIEIAKEIMEDEDKIDKELQRKLIKEKHRAKRLKEKEEKRKKSEEARKRFAERKGLSKPIEQSEEESSEKEFEEQSCSEESDHDEKLSKYIDELPDPDEYYNNDDNSDEGGEGDEDEDDNDNGEEDETDDQSDDEDESDNDLPRKKMKMNTDDDDDDDDDESDNIPLNLQDTESLAKQFVERN